MRTTTILLLLAALSASPAFADRRQSYFSDLAMGVVSGFGADSYRYALDAAMKKLAADEPAGAGVTR